MTYNKFQKIVPVFLAFLAFFYGGYYIGVRGIDISIGLKPVSVKIVEALPSDQQLDFNKFWTVWDKATAGKDKATVDKIYYNAITGMVSSLDDPYTTFLRPDVNKIFAEVMSGNFEGIGAELGQKDNQLVVISPLEGSPAKAAGLKIGDKILKINNLSTVGMSINEAVSKIRGPAGSDITLTIQSGDQPVRDMTITRGVITIASVTWQDKGNGIAYIKINQFGGDTANEWDKVVSQINASSTMPQLDAIIIDVRGNPGGYLQAAAHIAEEFFRDKPVLYEEDAMGTQTPVMASRVGSFVKVPAVFILVDGGSASASEILTGALKDQIGAKLIGTKTFGKGIIQDAKDLGDGSGIHITVAKWLTPNKYWVGDGTNKIKNSFVPDYTVERTDADIEKGIDPQLDKAIELAKKI